MLELLWLLGGQPGLALRAPPGEPLEPTWVPKELLQDLVPSRTLLLLVDLCVLRLALELSLKPAGTELHHVVHKGLPTRRTQERAQRKGMDPSSVQGFILNDVP